MLMYQANVIGNASASYLSATGKIDYGMTNDYMFRVILQTCNDVLRSLICALLHIESEQIRSVVITNPIVLGQAIDDKEFVMDINVLLNNDAMINLEMQVVNEHNWTDRSLAYMCRSFDRLYHGQKYEEALPVIHIGFLDFRLFKDHTEFYGIYKLLNVKDYYLFSDKLTLGVVDLTCIELATEEDKAYEIDYWARLFKATTWEELKMIAEKNEAMQEASQAIYEFSADELIRQQCRARDEYYRKERTRERDEAAMTAKIKEQAATIDELTAKLAEMSDSFAALTKEVEKLKVQLEQNK